MSHPIDPRLAGELAWLRRTAASLVGDYTDAEDVAQSVFIKAWQRWERYDERRGCTDLALPDVANRGVQPQAEARERA